MTENSETEGKIACAKNSNGSNGGIPASDAKNVTDGVRARADKASFDSHVRVKIDAPRGSGDLSGQARQAKTSFLIGYDGKFVLVGEQRR